ncbi:hypothetical protein [Desulfonatronum parangueonense]
MPQDVKATFSCFDAEQLQNFNVTAQRSADTESGAMIPILAKFRDQAARGAMLQPKLCPACITWLPHWGAALPGIYPLIATSFLGLYVLNI